MDNSTEHLSQSKNEIATGIFLNLDYSMYNLKSESAKKKEEINLRDIKKILSELDNNLEQLGKIFEINIDEKTLVNFRKLKDSGIDKDILKLTKFL